ncbi:MAG: D-2-hydroxyacid dehydrogenase [Flavobacteriales bacterium]|nr:D-2-hydroxyacid dehydrogenase [Flavobacteriales bacterium]
MKILANDGIDASGKKALEESGFIVITEKVSQEKLAEAINREGYIGLLVRSATVARKEFIDACPNLRFIGRGGVGIDNIDAEYARSKGVQVFNTPGSSSQAVAELVMSYMFAAARGLYDSGRNMPTNGTTEFETLKRKYSKGFELRGKTLGIIGFGRIGRSLAAYAAGCGMSVIFNDNHFREDQAVAINIGNISNASMVVPRKSFADLLAQSDFISLHVPKQPDGSAVITSSEFSRMKKGVVIINTARGGVVDEKALIENLDSGQVRVVALDVFVGEPKPNEELLRHPGVISTPHIGASTLEAQERIGLEIAERVCEIMGIKLL